MRLPARVLSLAVVAALTVARAPEARADDDELLASIYTETGYELRRDERLYTLFAAFNVAGFDRAEEPRQLPFPRRAFHPIRQNLRDALQPLSDKLRGPVDHFLDTHPLPLEAYEEAALSLGDAPDYKAGDGLNKDLAGLDKMLAAFAKDAKLSKLSLATATEYRAEFKKLRTEVDGPFSKLRAAFRLKEEDAPSLVLVPTPLDAPSAAFARRAPDGTHVVVFGLPAEGRVDLAPALRAYERLLAEEACAKVAVDGLSEAVEQLKTASILPADATAAKVLQDSLRTAVQLKLDGKPATEAEAAAKKGLLFVREFAKALDEPAESFPADKGSFVQQVAARVDVKKAVQEIVKPTEAQKATGGRK